MRYIRSLMAASLVAVLCAAAPEAQAFEILTPGYSCRGHEFLAVAAARTAGIPRRYFSSIHYGVRYVDLGGMTLAGGTITGRLNRMIHENEATQHHHFCLRGGARDLTQLVRDTTAWIQKLYNDARRYTARRTQRVSDGGAVMSNKHTVHTRFFLLGAAMHAIQDSFAHGFRTPTWGRVRGRFAGTILRSFGGRHGARMVRYYRTIHRAVLYPTAARGTARHNHVYTARQGSPYWSDKVWLTRACTTVRSHIGNLQPHAFAAYVASKEFLQAFRRGTGLSAFFRRWFGIAGRGYPGLGNPRGKCTRGRCPYLRIPGESAYRRRRRIRILRRTPHRRRRYGR